MLPTLEPTKKYFLTMFTVSCALLVVFTCVIYRQSEILQSRSEAVMRSYELLKQSRLVMMDALNMETSQRGFLLSGIDKFLVPYKDSIALMDEDMKHLGALLESEDAQRPNAEGITRRVEGMKKILQDHLERLGHSGQRRLTVKDLQQSKDAMDELRDSLEAVATLENTLLAEREEAAREQQRNYQYTLFVGTALGVGALVVANMLIYSLLTRGRETEKELRSSEERFQMIMNGVNNGIYDLNLIDRTCYHSAACGRMLGYDAGEYPDTVDGFKTLLHPDDVASTLDAYERYAAKETAEYTNEFRLRHKNGSWRWIFSRGVGLWDERGFMYRMVGSHNDITQQKEREEELRQLNNDMEGFTYIASHDLRAPLVNLRGFSSEVRYALKEVEPVLAEARKKMPEDALKKMAATFDKDVPEALGFIDAAVARMEILTSAILDMSRIGRREYRLENVNVQAVVARCIAALAHEISVKKIAVTLKPLPSIVADAVALEQIFGNLLDNAVKYLMPGKPGVIVVEAQATADEVLFSVTDNGRGIADSDTHRVFEIFRRASNSGDVRGSGMGMSYVKATLRKLGGRIWFESVLNQGTVFYFTLPMRILKETV